MPSTFKNGALLDKRAPEQIVKDWKQKEVLASAASVQWVEKSPTAIRHFPIFQQDGSGSCVMQTECKEMGIMRSLVDGNYVHFSVADGYQRRSNKPGSGMGSDDARRIAAEGITLEALAPSQNLSDAQLDATVVEAYKHDVGAIFAVPNHLGLPSQSIDSVASTIQATGKGVMVWFYFLIDEWTNKPTIIHSNLDRDADTTLRHSVTAVDFTMQGNEKCLVIEDSWGSSFGLAGQRIITESFFKQRNWLADYLVNFKYQQGTTPKPKHAFNVDLALNDQSAEVKALQDCLKWDGVFPTNADSTGFYGQITQKAVGDYQIKHGVVSAKTDVGYGRCGPKTRATLNLQFA